MNEQLTAVFTLNDSAFARGSDRILAALERIERKSDATAKSLDNGFKMPLGSLAKFGAGLFTIDKALDLLKQGLKVTSDFQRLDAGISNVSSSSLDFARTQAFVRKLSDDLGLSIEDLSSTYKNLKAATNGTNLEGAQTEKIFTAVVHAGAALKLTNEDVKGTLLALTQMISKGTVSMEEMRQQFGERVPGAMRLAANAMKVSEEELVKMISSGQVLAEDLLPKLADQLELTYGAKAQSNVNSMAGGWQRATDQLKLYIAEFSQTSGIDSFFSKLTNRIADATAAMREAQKEGFSVFNLGQRPEMLERAKLRQRYATANEGDRFFMLADLQSQADSYRDKANNPQKYGINEAVANANRRALADVEERIRLLRRDNIKLLGQEYEQAKKVANEAKKLAPGFDIDKAKDRQSVLQKQIQNLVGNGQAVPAKLRNEYNALTAQIERATNATKKHKEVYASTNGGITTDERLLKQYTDQIQEMGDKTPIATRALKALFEKRVEYNNWLASNKGVDLGESGKRIDTEKKFLDVLLRQVAPLQRMQGLLDRFSEVGNWGGIRFYQEQIEKIRFQADNLSLKNLKLEPEALRDLEAYVRTLTKADITRRNMDRQVATAQGKAYASDIVQNNANGNGWNNKAAISKSFTDSAYAAFASNRDAIIGNAQDMADTLVKTLNSGATAATNAMANFIDGLIAGTAGIEDLPNVVLGTVADTLKSLAQALSVSGALLLLVNPAQGAAQIAAGVGLYGVASGLSAAAKGPKRRAMAKGGTLSGPTEILAGEYPGASQKNRNEWVSPVDVGAKLIAENLMQMGGFGGGERLVAEIHASSLHLILQRYERIRRATGREK